MARHVFTIAPGAPFLATFVAALLEGKIVEGVSSTIAPLDLARISIFTPTRRAARALAVELALKLDRPAALLPRILPLGALDEIESAALLSFEAEASFDAFAPTIDEIDRRLTLAEFILAWARALKGAVVSPDGAGLGEAVLIAPTAVNACALAKELGALIDEFVIEDVETESVLGCVDESFDRYWAITRDFLGIALRQWPALLEERGAADRTARAKALLETQIRAISAGSWTEPVIALGSTGSNPTTARLLAAIAQKPRGAAVLPGLDQDIDDEGWRHIGDAIGERGEPAFTHPQSMLKRLLRQLGVERAEVKPLGDARTPLAARRRFVSQALRPADTTQMWRGFREALGAEFPAALEGVSLVEAPDENLEALALALFMREALETKERTAALITPDRQAARRVCAELARFGIEVDDSGGAPLASTPLGSLARRLAAMTEDGASCLDAAALLSHSQTRLGLARSEIEALLPFAEAAVLRVVPESGETFAARAARARDMAQAPGAHPMAQRVNDVQWKAIEDLFARLDDALAPLAALPRKSKLAARVEALARALEAVTVSNEAGDLGGAEELLELFDRLRSPGASLEFDATGFAALLDALLFEATVRGPRRAHPRLKILGPLEARLMEADLVLLAGLDEGVWPPQAETGAFLNRAMREALGLTPPERRIGQSAHDFEMALGAPCVVLSRALKRDGSPTVASRFLTRLEALAGDDFAPCKARGEAMLAIAKALDRPDAIEPCKRPEPRPPVALRPTQLSVTRIERLRRDPYSLYAERILKLTPLDPFGGQRGAREIGTAVHETLASFVQAQPTGPLSADADERLLALAQEKFAPFLTDPDFKTFRWPRLVEGLRQMLRFERSRREAATKIYVEERGEWRFPLFDGTEFRLTAVADRIEIDAKGAAFVFDYKTGEPPSDKQVHVGFAPQLTLEAAMLEAGAFEGVGRREVEGAAYVRVRGDGDARWIKPKNGARFRELVIEHRIQLKTLLEQFRDPSRSYPSRPFVAFAGRDGDYDHLARVKEWSREGGDET
ncbi:double-strand break repair protein AddB [Methylocystis bryophila]|uniref:Double-strand break repair protein AddB n=1 Tax=Methylocystis bryophila TaxID=655015 RepID=A0A1W6MYY4_9HYPH|nr:double-strand break repair protein AddB [Methylocystis bryophila]ARN82756.1 double-strand break repair protein AddB [Methylocystis bryophila]BDV38994.1 double-strand break repair protein AddB [Methylocystis bryophila]